jgi:putative membrane protein
MSVRRLIAAAGGLVTAIAAVPLGPLHAQGQISQLSQDSKIIFQMAASNLLEIRLGNAAQQKATSPAVKQFGQQMVTEHTNMHNQLTTLVSKSGTFKPAMGKENEEEVQRLEKLSGAEFDRAYMSSMIQHHQEDVAFLQSQSQAARSAEARQLIASGLPVLQQHLNLAIQVGSQVGATTTTVAGPVQNPPVTTGNPPVVTQNPPVTTQYPQGTGDVSADMPFIRQAASSNLMEIRLGQSAQSRATNAAVKQFAQRMVTDHSSMQNQLTSTASTSGQTFTPSLDSEHERQVNRIERLSGAEFDRAYMNLMIQAHQNDVSQFQTQSQSARSTQVRTLASNSLPVLQQHLSLAVQVGNQVGADTTTNVAGPNQPGGGDREDARADAEFIRDVGAGTLMEIRLAERAQKEAKERDVRRLAERLKDDFTELQEQWTNVASRSGISAKPGMGPLHREKIEQLEKTRGKNFDRTYMTLVILHLHDMVSYWQKEGRASRSAQVRQLVNRGLPTLEQDFSEAKRVGRKVGVDPDDTIRNRKDIRKDRNKA